ncbi:MAG: acyltransferase [Solirubrobacterales bacterium]|nr:acyltransferase [Solirubrobacterales bacterium]
MRALAGAIDRARGRPRHRTVDVPERVHLGRDVHLGDHAWLALVVRREVQVTQGGALAPEEHDPHLTIGDRTRFGRDLTVACLGDVTIGADVVGGDRILLGDTYHGYRDPDMPISRQPMEPARPLEIGDGAWLGNDVVVNPGVRIGAGAVVEHRAVVTRDVPPRAFVAGNPARVVRRWGPPTTLRRPGA